MRCVILQPSYLPWRGYFDQLCRADVFVFYDDVQYDARGWRNRNRVLGPGGPQWITIPVHHRGSQTGRRPIHTIEICWDSDWAAKHLRTLECGYARAPYCAEVLEWLAPFYQRRDRYLADFTIDLTRAIAARLAVCETRFLRSSELGRGYPECETPAPDVPGHASGAKTERLLSILRQLGATQYLTGPSARAYLDEALLARSGITVEYMRYDYPPYRQLRPGFEPQLSVVDLLFMQGPSAGELIRSERESPLSAARTATPAAPDTAR
jgi:hypothetical protein